MPRPRSSTIGSMVQPGSSFAQASVVVSRSQLWSLPNALLLQSSKSSFGFEGDQKIKSAAAKEGKSTV